MDFKGNILDVRCVSIPQGSVANLCCRHSLRPILILALFGRTCSGTSQLTVPASSWRTMDKTLPLAVTLAGGSRIDFFQAIALDLLHNLAHGIFIGLINSNAIRFQHINGASSNAGAYNGIEFEPR